jgi:hypothetical protein
MTETVTTTSQAESSSTPAAPAPARPGNDSVYAWEPPNPNDYALVRGANGGSKWVKRDSLSPDPSAQPVGSNSTANGTAPPAAVVDGKLVVGDMQLDEKDIKAILEAKGAEQARKATLPATPNDYVLELPADFKLPPGVDFQWQTDHAVIGPLLSQAKAFAHSAGLTQEQFGRMMSLYAASQTHEMLLVQTARDAEVAKLGATGPARVDAVTTFLRGSVGDVHAKAVMDMAFTANFITGLEKLATKFSGQGVAPFTQAGREPTINGKGPLSSMSDEQYSALSAQERYRIARQ